MRTTTALSRRQVGASRRAGNFLAVSRAFLSSRVPERAPEGRGWHGLAGWMKAKIRAKTGIREHDWADFRRPDKKKWGPGASPGSWLEMLKSSNVSPQYIFHEFSNYIEKAATKSKINKFLFIL
jgi:hypothetical protein